MAFREIGWGDVDWLDVAEGRNQWTTLVNLVILFSVS
jgi:hypothetical protein